MQLHLNADELNLFADMLLDRVGAMSAQRPSVASVQGNADMGQGARRYDALLDKVLVKDLQLDSDELEQAAGLLSEQKRDLRNEIARLQDSTLRLNLQRKLGLVERVLERVEEACAML
ncbi:MAG TPA: hypothetical protein VII23_00605 [Terriglobales bacterium]